jgi:hypothetical protein
MSAAPGFMGACEISSVQPAIPTSTKTQAINVQRREVTVSGPVDVENR